MRLKPGTGYYDTTDFPIGGAFRRAGDDGKDIAEVTRKLSPSYQGCNIVVIFSDGTPGACHTRNTEGG